MSVLLVAKKKLTGATFAARLQMARELAGMTQGELAEAASVHRVDVSRYERGKVTPSFDVACRLADALGVDVSEFRTQD
jgi:transcriptional regulator with XRE-family HTH domain